MNEEKIMAVVWVIGIIGFGIIVIVGWFIDCYVGFSSQYGSLPEGSYFNRNGTVGAIVALLFAMVFFILCVGGVDIWIKEK
jgi:hypothetical protein